MVADRDNVSCRVRSAGPICVVGGGGGERWPDLGGDVTELWGGGGADLGEWGMNR